MAFRWRQFQPIYIISGRTLRIDNIRDNLDEWAGSNISANIVFGAGLIDDVNISGNDLIISAASMNAAGSAKVKT